jgi:hypothetical protein
VEEKEEFCHVALTILNLFRSYNLQSFHTFMLPALPPTLFAARLMWMVMDVKGPVGCVGLKRGQVVIVAWYIMETFVRLAQWWSLTPADPERVVVVEYRRRMCQREEEGLGE